MSAGSSKRRARPAAAYLSLLLCLVYVDAVTSMVSCTSSEDGAIVSPDGGLEVPPDARPNDASGSGNQDAQQPGLDAAPPEMGLDAEPPDDAEPGLTDPDDADTDAPDPDLDPPDASVDADADADTDADASEDLPDADLIDATLPLIDADLIDAAPLIDAMDLIDAMPDA